MLKKRMQLPMYKIVIAKMKRERKKKKKTRRGIILQIGVRESKRGIKLKKRT
jgi:hypothetical protein